MSASGTVEQLHAFPRPLFSRWHAITLTLALTALYALGDFNVPGEYNVAILYGSSVVASGWARSPRFLWLVTALSVMLTYAGLAFGPQPPDGLLAAFYINRSLVAIGLIAVAAMVHQRMRLRRRMERAHAVELSQNQELLKAHEALHRIHEELEERVRQEVRRRIDVERSLLQAQKMEAIGQLAGGIAHDFNNMLAAIMANVELIRVRTPEGDTSRRQAENALLAARQAASFTKQLLGFARRQPIEPQIVAITGALNDVASLSRHVLPRTIELSVEASERVWAVHADPAQLESALLNLVINARDAMPDGGRVTIAARNTTVEAETENLPAGDYVRLSVVDTGCGMASEIMARAFEPLFTTKAVGKGTGLGLAMVYGFAKQSGGAACIESSPDCGTTVHIFLPRASDASAKQTE